MRNVVHSSLYRIAVLSIFATDHINQSINVTFTDQLDMEIIEWNTISLIAFCQPFRNDILKSWNGNVEYVLVICMGLK